MDTIKLQAQGEFPFLFYIEKAVPIVEDGKLIVEGIASTVNVDHDNERMHADALESMANIINQESVPLRLEHSQEASAVIGSVYKAWIDERNQLWIRAAIDATHPSGPMLHDSLKQGAKFGLSVGGKVRNAVRELVESTGKYVKTFYDVILDEVSVTRKPANYDAWLFAKSIKSKEADVSPYYDSPLYKQFLFENQKLDYIQQFAKSIPDSSWKKVDKTLKSNNNSMDDKEKKPVDTNKDGEGEKKAPMPADTEKDGADEKKPDEMGKDGESEKPEDTTKSYVSKSEFTKFAADVTKGFKAVMKALENNANDTDNPDKAKPTEIGDEGVAKDGMDVDPMKQTNPDEKKDIPDTQQVAKEGEEEKDTEKEGADEKKPDEMGKDGEDDKKPAFMDKDGEGEKKPEDMDKDGEDHDGEEYKVKSMSDAIARIASISKKSKGEKVTKSASKLSTIDQFAVTVAEALDSLEQRFEKSNIRVPGMKSRFIEMLKADKELQGEVRKMMKEPGMKKSVVMGTPYMTTRDGKKFALSAIAMGEPVQKSKQEGKSFKDVWGQTYSSENTEA